MCSPFESPASFDMQDAANEDRIFMAQDVLTFPRSVSRISPVQGTLRLPMEPQMMEIQCAVIVVRSESG